VKSEKRIYWHSDLPPLEDKIAGKYQVTAESDPIPLDYRHKDELRGRSEPSLALRLEDRLGQEIDRLGGHCAHILEEHITPVIDYHNNQYRLRGTYTYVLFLAPAN